MVSNLPDHLVEHVFHFKSNNAKAWALDIPVEAVDKQELDSIPDLTF